jgi:hypothetical protein
MFDASQRQTCKVRSAVTSTPLHALTTLNDPTWVEAARVLAARAFPAAQDVDGRLTFVFRRVLGRRPCEGDLALVRRAFERQLGIYQQDEKAAAELIKVGAAPAADQPPKAEHAALSAVCLALFNLDEALTRE